MNSGEHLHISIYLQINILKYRLSFDPVFLGVKAILTTKLEVNDFIIEDKVIW
jgi:hypothetical protein